ncbi:MAG: DUF6145 family protein [Lachnospiraceae bacterium]|nr:DUF6145 family protein [Lachnospiraceae bacterium]
MEQEKTIDYSKQLPDGSVVLCGANAYDEKYFFNPDFQKLPAGIQEELRIIAVLFTKETGGIFYIYYDEEGNLEFGEMSAEEDIMYDQVTAALLIGEIRRKRQELIGQLEQFYRVFILGEEE